MSALPTPLSVPLRTEEGVIRVGNTRVTLSAVIADFQRGAAPEEIVKHYSALNVAHV
jgi:uncharacterized protein (DUF433 family)